MHIRTVGTNVQLANVVMLSIAQVYCYVIAKERLDTIIFFLIFNVTDKCLFGSLQNICSMLTIYDFQYISVLKVSLVYREEQ